MIKEEIFTVLRTSKKYSKSNFEYNDYDITYTIGCHSYKIEYYSNEIVSVDGRRYSGKFSFYCDTYSFGVNTIKVSIMNNGSLTVKKILVAFGKLIRIINKLNIVLLKKEELIIKIKPIIISFIKKEYDFDVNFDENSFKVKFPNSTKVIRRRIRNTEYNVEIEDPVKISYNITFFFIEGNFSATLYFHYSEINELSMIRKDENYKNKSKDITKIIRAEKLKKLMLVNENFI